MLLYFQVMFGTLSTAGMKIAFQALTIITKQ